MFTPIGFHQRFLLGLVSLLVLIGGVVLYQALSISDTNLIRIEKLGEVYPGDIYTTLINLQKIEPLLPRSTPYMVVLHNDGSISKEPTKKDISIDFQKYTDGSYSIGNFSGEYREKTGGYELYTAAGDLLTTFTIKNNRDTDIHGITKLKNGNFIIPGYKLHTDNEGGQFESFFIEEQTLDGTVVFSWDSINYVPRSEARFTEERAYWKDNHIEDYFHGNSVTETSDGNLLISGRNINSIIKINKTTGDIIWRLGGVKSDFRFIADPENGFSHQHSVHELANGHILLFDNGNLRDNPYSRVVEYEVNEVTKTATLVWSYTDGRFCLATGSVQRLPNGNTLIGWGIELAGLSATTSRITEVDPIGQVVLQVYFPENSGLYNAFKY